MIILGAGGFAKEVATVLLWNKYKKEIIFFDNISDKIDHSISNKYSIIRNELELRSYFKTHNNIFSLGVGGTKYREDLFNLGISNGGTPYNLISKNSLISEFDTKIDINSGISILSGVTITANVKIGIGCLINKNCILSHDVSIGNFVEVSPGVKLLGHVKIGDYTTIGTGAIILPNINIGKKCTIGAGSVVTKNVLDNQTVIGIPAKPL
ncbi:NeuD/PglB/VioB family sugar acetyltransferase [Providencia stuartii]|uniref:NeuD/PglB/VioB family sugar acetyltransferase n=1 Tax=Providencia stuartii TaxID=588 RepID=UPI003CF4C7B4